MQTKLKKPIKAPRLKWTAQYDTSFDNNTPVEDLKLTLRATRCLKRANIHTLGALLEMKLEDLMDKTNLGAELVYVSLEYLFNKGYRPADYDEERHDDFDAYIIDKAKCRDCGWYLEADSNPRTQRCKDCDEKAKRRSVSKTFALELLEQDYNADTLAFDLFVNITNITGMPIKMKIKEISVFSYGRQRIGEIVCQGEEYALPKNTRTISARIQYGENEEGPNADDYATISLLDVDSGKIHSYVYTYNADRKWTFMDYFEIG